MECCCGLYVKEAKQIVRPLSNAEVYIKMIKYAVMGGVEESGKRFWEQEGELKERKLFK